jgi:dienelactone hydrolase
VHEWTGLNAYAKRRAKQLAELGYIAFAVDMYGKGIRATDHEEAAKLSGVYRSDRQLMRRRILAGLEELKRHPLTDGTRLAAIGYCFGGMTVLELARSGADVVGVVSFHGGLSTPHPADAAQIKGQVLVLHGADDTFVTPEEVAAFESDMRQAGVRYRLITYPGAVHSFTVPEAGDDPSTGMAYNAEADTRSWEEMRAFLRDVFFESELKHIGRAGALRPEGQGDAREEGLLDQPDGEDAQHQAGQRNAGERAHRNG